MKNWKTTALGIISLILTVISLTLVYFDKATLQEAGSYLGMMLGFIVGLNAFLTKDHDKE